MDAARSYGVRECRELVSDENPADSRTLLTSVEVKKSSGEHVASMADGFFLGDILTSRRQEAKV